MEPIRFGKFWLLDKIATGGMAEIFRSIAVTAEGKQQILAIKRILPQFSSDDEFVSLLVDEAKLMVFLNHPNIVPIVEFGKIEDSYYIAMEFVDGTTLKGLFRKVRELKEHFSIEMAVHIAREIGMGLAYAHRKTDESGKPLGIVHRDISPANILMSFGGEVKISDFGISKAANQSHRTQIGVIRGKTGYMSPEQTKSGESLDQRSDLYSLAIILYELLTGERLYKAESIPEALRMIRKGDVPSMVGIRPEIPTQLEQIVRKALAPNPEERYQRVEEWVDALNEFLTRWAPQGRPMRVTHTDLVEFLRRFFTEQMDEEKTMAATLALEVAKTKVESWSQKVETSRTPVRGAIPLTIAANPRYELSEPEFTIDSAQTLSLQDAMSASIKIAKGITPLVVAGFVSGVVVIFALFVFTRKSNESERPSIPAATATPLVQVATPSPPPKKPILRTVRIITRPENATVYLNGKKITDRTQPLEVGKVYRLRVEAKGYIARETMLDPTVDTKMIDLSPEVDEPVRKPPPKVSTTAPLGEERAKETPVEVSFQSTPWSEIWLDGKKAIGTTPLVGVRIPSGQRRIVFKNPAEKRPLEITVSFRPNQKYECIAFLRTRKGTCRAVK